MSSQKQPDNIGEFFQPKAYLCKMFEGELFIRSISTTPLQIVCKIILNFQVIVKSIRDQDGNFKSYCEVLKVKIENAAAGSCPLRVGCE